MREAVIVDCLRTAVGKAPRGALRNTRPDDLAAMVIRALLGALSGGEGRSRRRDPRLRHAGGRGREQHGAPGVPARRPAGFGSGVTINRFCSSGLQAIALAADRIRSGGADIMIAGGSESMC